MNGLGEDRSWFEEVETRDGGSASSGGNSNHVRQRLIQEVRAPTLQDVTSGYPYTRALAHVIPAPNPTALDYPCSEKVKLANVG